MLHEVSVFRAALRTEIQARFANIHGKVSEGTVDACIDVMRHCTGYRLPPRCYLELVAIGEEETADMLDCYAESQDTLLSVARLCY